MAWPLRLQRRRVHTVSHTYVTTGRSLLRYAALASSNVARRSHPEASTAAGDPFLQISRAYFHCNVESQGGLVNAPRKHCQASKRGHGGDVHQFKVCCVERPEIWVNLKSRVLCEDAHMFRELCPARTMVGGYVLRRALRRQKVKRRRYRKLSWLDCVDADSQLFSADSDVRVHRPENRILVGLAKHKLTSLAMRAECETNSDRKLSHIYAKIHGFQVDPYKDKASGPLLASSTARLLQQPVAVAE
eukprot:6186927-Pleurochrysis_carterae.AAC.3